MKNILLGILVLGTITGILPILFVSFLAKHIVLMVGLLIITLLWISKELCE